MSGELSDYIKDSYEEFKAELLRNPEIRKEYEALKPKYEAIKKAMVATSKSKGLPKDWRGRILK